MGNETILYYVTQDKILGDCNVLPELLAKRAGRKKIWQKERLPFFMVEQDNLTIYTILIPTKGKKWKPEKLLRLMQNTQETWQNDFAKRQIVLQQDIAAILHWEKEEIPDTFLLLSDKILGLQKKDFDSVVLLLGNVVFPEVQMRYFIEVMQPFFSRINHLSILYVTDEEEQERWQDVVEEYAEAFYFEYGLMTQILGAKGKIGQRTLFLDYGYAGEIPLRMMRAGDIYLDVAAAGKKEMLLKRKCAEVSYLSPLKYLDTTVKSGYDKLVHLCK